MVMANIVDAPSAQIITNALPKHHHRPRTASLYRFVVVRTIFAGKACSLKSWGSRCNWTLETYNQEGHAGLGGQNSDRYTL